MKNPIRSISAFLGGALLAVLILWAISPVEIDPIEWDRLSDQAIVDNIENASLFEIERYVETIHAEPLPADYVIPAHVANSANHQRANAAVDHKYPEFSGKYNEDLFAAVKQHPLLYRDYIREKLAVRRIFDNRNQSAP